MGYNTSPPVTGLSTGAIVVCLLLILSGCSSTAADEAANPESSTASGQHTESSEGTEPLDEDTESLDEDTDPTVTIGSVADATTTVEQSSPTNEPQFTETDLAAFAEAVDANMVLAKPDQTKLLVWHDGTVTTLDSFDVEGIWADGTYVYQWFGEGRSMWSKASTSDGTLVCEVEGFLHHITERTDGSFVAAVEPSPFADEPVPSGQGNPLMAEDCITGHQQPIDPVSFPGEEVGVTVIERIGGREFTLRYDAEGNASIENEAGITVNGDDYSGYAVFDQRGTAVAYGDMAAGAGPHYSSVVIARNTTTADRLWTVDLQLPFIGLDFVDDRVVAQLPENAEDLFGGQPLPASAVVLDGTTGQELKRIPLAFPVLHLS